MDQWARRGLELAAIGAPVAAMAWAVRGRSASVFGPSVWHGRRDRRSVALTFDDGPSEGTPEILEILGRHGVAATFFQCGANVERLPALAREVKEAGHEIGNHSHSHKLLCFRSPHGVRWFGIGGVERRLQLTGVMWTIIGYDWNRKVNRVVERVSRRVSS